MSRETAGQAGLERRHVLRRRQSICFSASFHMASNCFFLWGELRPQTGPAQSGQPIVVAPGDAAKLSRGIPGREPSSCADLSKRIWGLKQHDRSLQVVRQIAACPQSITSFGTDEQGRIYVVGYEGMIYQLDLVGAEFR